jgi:hypothetical protein
VKLQAKIADFQTGYWSGITIILTFGITGFVTMVALAMQTKNATFLGAGGVMFVGLCICAALFGGKGTEKERVELRKDFEKIYNKKPIEY